MMQSSSMAHAGQRLTFGLRKEEIILSKSRYGTNQLTKKKGRGFIASFIAGFGDPMIRVLLIALAVNIVFLFGHSNWYESLGILVAILIAVTVSTISEMGSEAAFAKLQKEAQNTNVRVRREGETLIIPVCELVVGDIVILNAGDRVPADGRILTGKVGVDQSSLNGESKEAQKIPLQAGESATNFVSIAKTGKEVKGNFSPAKKINPQKNDATQNDFIAVKYDFLNTSLLFCGSVVTTGECIMEVVSVGDNTAYGRLAAEVQEATPDSPLKQRLTILAKKISFYGYIGAGLVALSYLFNSLIIQNSFDGEKILSILTDFREMFSLIITALTLSVTVIVMAVPEGLPMMITVALSSNMRRMLKDNVLIRKLNGIETAGSMNILFTDKTGTLTYGMPEVMCVLDANGKEISQEACVGFKNGRGTISQSVHKEEMYLPRLIAASLFLNNGAEMIEKKAVGGNSTDRAIMDYTAKLPIDLKGCTKISTFPFDSSKKFMATRVRLSQDFGVGSGELTLIKGAPEKIIACCSHYYLENGQTKELFSKDALKKKIEEMSGQAARLIALAFTQKQLNEGELTEGLVLIGLVAIRDKVRREAKRGVRQVKDAGIQTVMITGDAKGTAIAIALETEILTSSYAKNGDSNCKNRELVLTSEELSKLSDEELSACLRDLRVVARALPSDKSRLVRIAQSLNLVAGMTGDGVNDAPALKKADIGFAMGSGTEVAKEAGDVVILDDNILSISKAVLYGRTIFKSIRKFVIFQMSINFCAMAVSIVAPLINAPLPITVIQMLWINLVIDTLAGLAFCGERPRAKYMQEKPKRRDEPIANKYMMRQILITGIYTAIVSIWFLKSDTVHRLLLGQSETYKKTAFFTMFMFMAIFNSFCARTQRIRLWDYLSLNKQFIWIMSAIAAIQILLIYFGSSIFGMEKLNFQHLMFIILISLTVIPLDLIRKMLLLKKSSKDMF